MIEKIIPAFGWLPTYKRSDMTGDLSASLIVAIMLVPQAMAYAMLAGLPPVIGLYSSTVPLIIYALFGSSRQLAVGPVAMVSLLVFVGASKMSKPGTEEYIALIILLSLMVGVIQFAMGLFRMGFLVNFLSDAVINGFTSAAAIVIMVSQLKHLLGVKLSGGFSPLNILLETGQRIGETNIITLAIGLASIAVLVIFRKKKPHFPAPILVVAGGTLGVYLLRLHELGVEIIGSVPKGLPGFSVPTFSLNSMVVLLPTAMTIFFVAFMESISIGKLIAVKENYKIDSNQELKGLGLANMVGSFFSAYPVTGGFSRTAVNYQAGARTALASIITGVLIIMTLLFLTPLFFYLPKAVLAAIIIVAVFGLIDVREATHYFKVKQIDGWTLVLSFVATLTLGIEQGILIGIVFSLLVFIWRSSHPHTAVLGYLVKENVFRNVKRFPEVKTYPEMLILRVDASLYFANMSFLEDRLRESILDKPEVRWIVIDMSGVNDIDAVAIKTIDKIMENYKEMGINFAFAGMKGPVRDLVAKTGWKEKYGEHISCLSLQDALQKIGLLGRYR